MTGRAGSSAASAPGGTPLPKGAAAELTELFQYNIPARWSVAHLYHAMKQGEPHVKDIAYLTTLAGYVHWKLTGQKVLGVGEAAGMFPVEEPGRFCSKMLSKFDSLLERERLPWKLEQVLPQVLLAGEPAGELTEEGAKLLDPTGAFRPGVPFCPPEGDAGTGMAATNSVSPRTGNVSAGTSIFAMVVLEKPLSQVHREIDLVATPAGLPVAMVHCNTCTSDLDAWVKLFSQLLQAAGAKLSKGELYDLVYHQALEGDPDCGGPGELQLLLRGAGDRPGGGAAPLHQKAGVPPDLGELRPGPALRRHGRPAPGDGDPLWGSRWPWRSSTATGGSLRPRAWASG